MCQLWAFHVVTKRQFFTFIYVTVRSWIADDVPFYLKFALRVTRPFRKRRFWQILLNSASAMISKEKSSIITNRKSTMCFQSSHRWTLCATPKSLKGWLKTMIFTYFALPFISSLRVIVYTSNLVCWLIIASPSIRTTNCPWNGRDHVTWSTLNLKVLNILQV